MILAQTAMGAGILALPYAFSNLGYAFGTLMLLVSSGVSAFTLHLLSVCVANVGGRSTTFGSIAQASYPRLGWIADLLVVVVTFGVCSSFLIVVGDNLPLVVSFLSDLPQTSPGSVWLGRHVYIALAWALVCVPLSVSGRLDLLKYTSLLAIASVVFTMVLVVVYYVEPSDSWNPCGSDETSEAEAVGCLGDVVAFNDDFVKIMTGLPLFVFAYGCHGQIFGIYNELKVQKVRSMNFIVVLAVSLCALLYTVCGLFGYLIYGSLTQSNILLNFPLGVASSVARLAMSLVVILTYPLAIHPCRLCTLNLISTFVNAYRNKSFITPQSDTAEGPADLFGDSSDDMVRCEVARETKEISGAYTRISKGCIDMHDCGVGDANSANTQECMPEKAGVNTSAEGDVFEAKYTTGTNTRCNDDSQAPALHITRENKLDDPSHNRQGCQALTHDPTGTATAAQAHTEAPACAQQPAIHSPYATGRMEFIAVTVVMLAGTFALAMGVSDLGLVFGLIGATASTMEVFVLPGAIYVEQMRTRECGGVRGRLTYWLAVVMIPFGFAFGGVAVACTLMTGGSGH
ncbi:hypothetical protein SARC_09034 [Sphaeroforma arctica JP610]|uniref:Amino acid transporter transmembrane domain-containing protein n=1 Tax=Sphaeroforma arctica JP610 TaxID=667725 RepID=A0A0L0FNX9_9EUKA|nr:hypothetical protein SARC_09034 [Sphaeroforma arctica JP610]KNC78540.1 hypothetical protein SARC_09034 [Sphaeroforma arctica JP610]|eukprot:XP_014152442.1 hypothetical protein SARC_09034 [Sphaeroforma arctica JP610]